MRTKLVILVGVILILYSQLSLASCGGGSGCNRRSQSQDTDCASGSCYKTAAPEQTSSCSSYSSYGSSCGCTDPGCQRSGCISGSECCHVYGNVGATDY